MDVTLRDLTAPRHLVSVLLFNRSPVFYKTFVQEPRFLARTLSRSLVP
jgi:hypothetical protein